MMGRERPTVIPAVKVALVTGTSSGFGKAIAEALHARGYRVYGAVRRADAADPGSGVRPITMDVTDETAVTAGLETILREQGRLDVLVNNAGFGYAGAIEDTAIEEARAQLETNFLGVHRLCRGVLPTMRSQGSGRIVNMGSLGGLVSVPFQAFYCATKFAVEAYTEALRMEIRPFGIHVSLIEPGDFATHFTSNRRLVRAASGPASAYAARCRAALARASEDERANADIRPVVRTTLRAIEARSPRLRYPVANALQRSLAALRPLLPQPWFEHLIMDSYRIR